MVKHRDLNQHPTRNLNLPSVVLEWWCQWLKHQKQGVTFGSSNTIGNTTTNIQITQHNKNNYL